MRILRATLAAAALGTALAGPVAAKDFYRMSTLAPGSTIYVITAGFAQIVNKHVPEMELQVNATGTAVQFMLDAGRGNLDFYFSAALTGHFMKTGGAMYANVKEAPELYKNLRGIFSFSSGAFQFVTYDDSGIRTLADIKGKRVFLGPPAGGATVFAQGLVEGATGYKAGADFDMARMGFGAAQQAFQDRKIDVWLSTSLVPSAAIQEIALTNKIRIVGLTDADFGKEAVKKAMALPGRSKETIPPKVYGANQVNTEPVYTGAAWVGIGTRKGIADDVVYRATKAFWDNIDELYAQGAAMKNVNLENALKHMPTPLHPGALRYYKEKGVAIPPELMAQN
jgi:hypothetical protein